MEAARAGGASSNSPLRLVRGETDTDALAYDELVGRAQHAEVQGRRQDARDLYEIALRRLPDAHDGSEASEVLRWIARTHRVDGDLDLALECADAALAVARAHNRLASMGHATNLLAVIRWQQGDLDGAEALYNQARECALNAGEAKLAAMTAQNLGVIANVRGDLPTALDRYEESLAAYRRLGLANEVCMVLNNLGLLHTQSERWEDASREYGEALRVAEVLGDQSAQLLIEVNRADWSIAQGDFITSRRTCDRGLKLAATVKDAPALGELHKAIGVVERETGDIASAERHLMLAHEIAVGRQDMLLLADTTKELAEVHRRQGRNRDALQCLNRAHRHFAQLRARRELADLDRRLNRLESDFIEVVRRWGESIECNDDYTQGHCERVAAIACALAAHDGMDAQSLFWFRIGALLHDVGKLVIPPEVLNKRGKLTEDEWLLMRSHPTAGVAMLADVEFPWDVGPIVEGHHERWDGTGYPGKLAGESIPRVARMVCIADVYDALTSERSYKKGMSHNAAMEVMRADVGRQFDPALFEMFEEVARTHEEAWRAPTRVLPESRRTAPSNGAVQLDELTGLPLRRAFSDAAREALAGSTPAQPVSLLVIDVDHFKLINDTYGHLQGDVVLRGIAAALREHTPDTGFVGRFAGDEFVVLLPGTGLADAMGVAERLRGAAHAIPVAIGRAAPVALTLSIGVTSAAGGTTSLEMLFAAADRALYDAKRRGRDTVAHGDGKAPESAPRPEFDTFIARDTERRRLTNLLTRAAAGTPQVVSIVGEAGVGKSALVRALSGEVRMLSGSLVAGRCADSEMRAPYWPWISALGAIRAQRVVPERAWSELTRLMPAEGGATPTLGDDRLRLFEEVSEFLRLATASRPFILVLDDMQWADGPSWDLLEYVATRLDHERLLICLTIREEDADGDVLVRRARLSRDPRFHEVRIGRLGRPELGRWIRHAFQQEMPEELAAYLYGRSEGNPFFAVQLLGAMLENDAIAWEGGRWQWHVEQHTAVPTPVRDLLGRRLARLSGDTTRVLSAAAVIGRSVDLDLVVASGIATEDELLDAIDEGTRARVLMSSTANGDDRATFTHALFVEVMHQQMHPRRLRRLREQIDRTLAERTTPARARNDRDLLSRHDPRDPPVLGSGPP